MPEELKERHQYIMSAVNCAETGDFMRYTYKTKDTCSQTISMDVDGNIIRNVEFVGGCNGNLKAIPILIDGWTVEEIEGKLTGVKCGRRPTSCADQLAKAVREAYEAYQREQ